MQKRILTALAVMVFVLAAASAVFWTHLRRTKAAEQQRAEALQAEAAARLENEQRVRQLEKDQARLDQQNQELSSLAQSLRANESKQSSNLTALAKQLAASTTNATGEATGASGAEGGFAGMMEKMMKDPAMREMMRGQQKLIMNQMYGPLFKDLALTPEQKQKFMDIQIDGAMKSVEHAGLMFKKSEADKSEAVKAVVEQQAEVKASLKALLGDEKFAQYEDYKKTVGDRTQLNQFKQQLEGDDSALQDSQFAQLMQILKEEKARVPPVVSEDPDKSAETLQAMTSEETMNKQFQWQEELNKRVLERAVQTLTPGQLKEYDAFLQQQMTMQRMGVKMAREMFGGGKGDAPAAPAVVK
jgi:hypothetical protein